MTEKVRKEIHLPANVVRALIKIAAKSGTTPKKYIEELVLRKTQLAMTRLKKHRGYTGR
jgi:hypothetical protein